MKKLNITLTIVPIILFAMLALCISAGIGNNFESWAYSEITEHMSPIITNIVKFITYIGDPITIILICFILLAYSKTRLKFGLPVSITVIVSFVLNLLLKRIFARERPDILRLVNETTYSFPSAHAMVNTSLYTMLVLLILNYIKDKKNKIIAICIFTILPILIGLSRIYLGVHYALDVLGGYILGVTIAIFVYHFWVKETEIFKIKIKDENLN